MTQLSLLPAPRLVPSPCLYETHCGHKAQVERIEEKVESVSEYSRCLVCRTSGHVSWTRTAWDARGCKENG